MSEDRSSVTTKNRYRQWTENSAEWGASCWDHEERPFCSWPLSVNVCLSNINIHQLLRLTFFGCSKAFRLVVFTVDLDAVCKLGACFSSLVAGNHWQIGYQNFSSFWFYTNLYTVKPRKRLIYLSRIDLFIIPHTPAVNIHPKMNTPLGSCNQDGRASTWQYFFCPPHRFSLFHSQAEISVDFWPERARWMQRFTFHSVRCKVDTVSMASRLSSTSWLVAKHQYSMNDSASFFWFPARANQQEIEDEQSWKPVGFAASKRFPTPVRGARLCLHVPVGSKDSISNKEILPSKHPCLHLWEMVEALGGGFGVDPSMPRKILL